MEFEPKVDKCLKKNFFVNITKSFININYEIYQRNKFQIHTIKNIKNNYKIIMSLKFR